jgi:gliding motility-associated-like protein
MKTTICLFQILLFCITNISIGQSYFKIIDTPQGSYYQQIQTFPNGDLLVADKLFDEDQPFAAKHIALLRINECGETLWAKSYKSNAWIIAFEKMNINEAGEIFILADWYSSSVFRKGILKLSPEGDLLIAKRFHVLDAQFTDSYDLQVRDGRVMVFSFLQYIPNLQFNHIFLLDEDLNLLWNKRISPNKAFGEILFTSDLGMLYQTGNTLIKLDATGNAQWANTIEEVNGVASFSKPLEVTDGYIWGVSSPIGYLFFKIDFAGNLIWKSDKVLPFNVSAELELRENGDVLAVYSSGNPTLPTYFTLSSTGEISEQHRLSVDFTLNTGFVYSTLNDDERVNLLGNIQMNFQEENANRDFLMQFDLNHPNSDCLSWETLDNTIENDVELTMLSIETTVEDFELEEENPTSIVVENLDIIFTDVCELEKKVVSEIKDTLLNCFDSWTIDLPAADFIWEDGSNENPRILTLSGNYLATKTSCLKELTYEYQLTKNQCACDIFLPNVFSPNEDGMHDNFQIYSDCEIVQMELQIFNRWGDLLFESTNANWDGTFNGKVVNAGVYVLKLTAQTSDGIGAIYDFEKFQSITVL